MEAILVPETLALAGSRPALTCGSALFPYQIPCPLLFHSTRKLPVGFAVGSRYERVSGLRRSSAVTAAGTLTENLVPSRNGVYTVGDFMTKKEDLHVVKATTTVDEALEMLVENRITGFPVIDDDWKLVGLVSDYDLLALDSISGSSSLGSIVNLTKIGVGLAFLLFLTAVGVLIFGVGVGGPTDTIMFPEVDRTWKTFNEIQKLLSKTNGKLVGDLMTPAPVVVRESTNLEDAARLLLETKYRRLPVVDADGKLVGIITRGNVVRAALQIKRSIEMKTKA